MALTITVRFICYIFKWNWTNIHLSHNFPILISLSVNLAPQLQFPITMGNTNAITNNFYCLTDQQQRKILESCMHHESITWARVAALASLRVKDQQFLTNLIKSHKNGTAVPTTPASQDQGMNKRPNAHIIPEVMKPAAFLDWANTDAGRNFFTRVMQQSELLPNPMDAQAQTAAAINNTIGNMYKSTAWANVHLAPMREENWICTRSPGASSFYRNPTKAVHTLFNYHQIIVSDSDLSNIEYINSLKQPELLATSVQKAFLNKGVTLILGNRDFADVFACTDPELNPILIVAVAKVHAKFEKNEVGTPQNENFTVLLLLFQSAPHVCLPFSGQHSNLHIGRMIRDKNYNGNGTFDKYTRKNVNHKLVPIQNCPPDNHTIERELHLEAYYTTSLTTTNTA